MPAPIYQKTVSKELNMEVAKTVKFNETLCHQIVERKLNLIDVYKFTIEIMLFNESFHIDSHHLASSAILRLKNN